MAPSLFIPESHKLGERGQKQTKGFHFVKQPNKAKRWVRQKLSTSQEEEQEFSSSSSSSSASSFSHGQLSVPIGQQHICLLACCTFFLLASGYMSRK
jgi:hypothetical protein